MQLSNEAIFYKGADWYHPCLPPSCETDSEIQQSSTCLDTARGPLRYTNI